MFNRVSNKIIRNDQNQNVIIYSDFLKNTKNQFLATTFSIFFFENKLIVKTYI